MLLPVLSKAKARAMQASCGSNLRQLSIAWTMYATDNGGRLVESYPYDNPNVWVRGDMTKESEATNTALIQAGKLFSYNQNVSIYRCPTDRGTSVDGQRLRTVRSYSMNSFMGARDPSLPPIPTTASPSYIPFFAKESDLALHNASELFVLIDEDERSINDGFFITDPSAHIWFDFPTIASHRHRFSYTISYADGHAKAWKLSDPRTRQVVRNSTEQANNPDLQHLARSATVPK